MVYIQITRGAGPRRRHAFMTPLTPTELLWVEEYDDGPTAVSGIVCAETIFTEGVATVAAMGA